MKDKEFVILLENYDGSRLFEDADRFPDSKPSVSGGQNRLSGGGPGAKASTSGLPPFTSSSDTQPNIMATVSFSKKRAKKNSTP
jgi:hypothetical protein